MGALYLQQVLGYDALQTGLAFLPSTLMMGTLSLRYAERLMMRFGARGDAAAGPGAQRRRPRAVHALAGRRQLRGARPAGDAAARRRRRLSFPALMTLSMSGATPSDAGLASGLVNTTLQVGGALGLAVLATLSSTRTEDLRAAGDSIAGRAERRLPPRLPRRWRADPGRVRHRAARAPARAQGGRGSRDLAEGHPAPSARARLRRRLKPPAAPPLGSLPSRRFRGEGRAAPLVRRASLRQRLDAGVHRARRAGQRAVARGVLPALAVHARQARRAARGRGGAQPARGSISARR